MLDTTNRWKRPVTIRLAGRRIDVGGPVQARHILLVDWPAERTDKHKIASDICLAAMEGADAEPAWVAFMEAAIEAKIFVA